MPVEKRSVKDDLKRIFKHKEILPVILVWCLSSLGYGLMFGSSVYYITYYIGRPDLIGTYMGVISVGGLISSFVIPPIALKIFKTGYRAFQWTQAFTAIAYVILFFFGKNTSILFPVSFIATLFATASTAFVGILINDTIDYIQLKEGVSLKCHEYFCGISDLSYCGGMDKEELAAYAAQTPLWGSAYAMDIEAMAKLKIPSMLFGPWGKDIHTRWERVNKASLYEKTPAVLKNFIEQMFDK